MKTVAIFPNVTKPEAPEVIRRIIKYYSDKDVRFLMPVDESRFFDLEQYGVADIAKEPVDFALSIGGDGTLLGVCRLYGLNSVPVCGINIGTLGFMADIELDELETKLGKLLAGDYQVEKRLLLAGFLQSEGHKRFLGHAINDIVLTKGGVARMLQLGLYINDTHLIDYKADGLIVSTPTGSTAYSLSAGGPIMNPNINALLLTPICAHTLNMRPIAISDTDVVRVKIAAVHQDIIVTLDGQESFRLLPGDEVTVAKAQEVASIIKFEDKNYYQILRNKLWKNL